MLLAPTEKAFFHGEFSVPDDFPQHYGKSRFSGGSLADRLHRNDVPHLSRFATLFSPASIRLSGRGTSEVGHPQKDFFPAPIRPSLLMTVVYPPSPPETRV